MVKLSRDHGVGHPAGRDSRGSSTARLDGKFSRLISDLVILRNRERVLVGQRFGTAVRAGGLTKNIVALDSSFVHQYPSELSFNSLAISRSTFRKVFILNPNLRPMGARLVQGRDPPNNVLCSLEGVLR